MFVPVFTHGHAIPLFKQVLESVGVFEAAQIRYCADGDTCVFEPSRDLGELCVGYEASDGFLLRLAEAQVEERTRHAEVRGDIDGVICIPREIAYDVLLRAEGIERNETDIFSWVRQGDTISEIIDKGGYF